MQPIHFKTTKKPDFDYLQTLINADPQHPLIHSIDMPYRLASTWQDLGCEVGIWEADDKLVAWAVFLPAWWNLDYAILPTKRGTLLEKDIFTWGQEQMIHYAKRVKDDFYGSVEIFANMPHVDHTIKNLTDLGFTPFDWSTLRFAFDLQQDLPKPQLPKGFTVRPLRGYQELEDYVILHRAAFQSNNMTTSWRNRTLEHPAYKPEIDLVITNPEDKPVGFCICWKLHELGQIEPLGVLPEYQGKGLGRALELTALKIMQNQSAKYVFVDHISLNEKAISLSKQNGFKQINNALRYFIDVNP